MALYFMLESENQINKTPCQGKHPAQPWEWTLKTCLGSAEAYGTKSESHVLSWPEPGPETGITIT